MIKNYGFVKPIIENDQYVLGGLSTLPKNILQADRNWQPYLPVYEPQFNSIFDSYGCTVWGTENAIEILEKKLIGNNPNYSERFIYILAGVKPPGANPHDIAETIREHGLIPDDLLPMTSLFEEFLQPKPMSKDLLNKGKELPYQLLHEWIWKNSPSKEKRLELIRESLQYSPLGVSVTAWFKDGDTYVDNGQPNTHWCVLFAMDGDSPLIFDSYDQSIKKLHPDHRIEVAKRYSLAKKVAKKKFLQLLLEYIRRVFYSIPEPKNI